MSAIVALGIGIVTTGVGLWLHDWRTLVAGGVCIFAAWLLRDVDTCIALSRPRDDGEWLTRDLIARTVQTTRGTEASE